MAEFYGVEVEYNGHREKHVWEVKDGYSKAMIDPDEAKVKLGPDETVAQGIKRSKPDVAVLSVIPMQVPPGSYYPRIFRPQYFGGEPQGQMAGAGQELSMQIQQVRLLYERLDQVFRHIHPEGPNLDAYDHETRNLLILACTEVEAMWKGVLRANHVPGQTYNTNHYVKLMPALRLDEYAGQLAFHPWLGDVRPFVGWSAQPSPTETLPWYSAYNAVKHDREGAFHRGSLRMAATAVLACQVMLFAQAGPGVNALSMVLTSQPSWKAHEMYFDSNHLVTAADHPF